MGDEQHVLRAGESILAPRGVPHTVRAGDRGGRWLVTSTPAGFEAFVRAVGSTDPQAALPSPDGADAHRAPSTASRSSARPGCSRRELEARAA